jgi:energy-coupling factor transporter ATP-binding protein EcfA2
LRPFLLAKINLIVGRNASGKSRLINVINGLALMLSGSRNEVFNNGHYRVDFVGAKGESTYELTIEKGQVVLERYTVGGEIVLERLFGGPGQIKATQIATEMLRFETPPNRLAAVVKRDAIQHPFLEELYEWGRSVKHYKFGTPMGANEVAIEAPENQKRVNAKLGAPESLDPNKLFIIFRDGMTRYGEVFRRGVIKTLRQLDYKIATIGFEYLERTEFQGSPIPPSVLFVKEKDLACNTRQLEMSAGMFRAVNLAIQLTYWSLSNAQICMLIDDVGEGLDYDRSTRLIRHLVEQAKRNNFQLIMTTNDRFVMNDVPLQYWGVIERKGHTVRVINKNNSPDIFDSFEDVGLNNFDFFARKLYKRSLIPSKTGPK